jgi:glucose-1-phosphate thymidylyltransferase
VAGKPVLGHILDKLIIDDLQDVVFIVGYLGDQIEQYVKTTYPDIKAHYVEQKELNGQAPAILLARDLVQGPTLIVFVDTLTDADVTKLKDEQSDGVIYVKEVEDPRRFGVVVQNAQGNIARFVEKPSDTSNRLAVIGMYYIRDIQALMRCCAELVELNLKTKDEYFLADALNLLVEDGAVLRPQTVEVWLDCGKPETVLQTNHYLLEHGHDNSAEWQNDERVIIPPVHIHPTAHIERSVIGPYTTIGEDCHIVSSIVRESVVDAGAMVSDQVLANSLIGRDAVLMGRPRRFNVGDSSVVGFDEE